MSGLTSRRDRRQWADDHIARCTCCGLWEIVTDIELRMRAAELLPQLDRCEHLNPGLAATEAAS